MHPTLKFKQELRKLHRGFSTNVNEIGRTKKKVYFLFQPNYKICSEAATRRCSEDVFKNFLKFTGKHLWQNLLFWDSDAGVFLWILRIFYEHFFLQNTSGACFCLFQRFTSKIKGMFWYGLLETLLFYLL